MISMSIHEDAKKLGAVMEALELNDLQRLAVLELIIILRPVLDAYCNVLMSRDKMEREKAEAVAIAAMTTSVMAYTVHRESLISGTPPEDYVKDLMK